MFVEFLTDTEVKTHEIRINAPISDTVSQQVGAFMSDLELLEHNMFTYPGAVESYIGWGVNYALPILQFTVNKRLLVAVHLNPNSMSQQAGI